MREKKLSLLDCPRCRTNLRNCFAYLSGVCMLLTDTNFKGNYGGTKCPFYKNSLVAKDARIRCLNQFKDEEIKEVADEY